MIKETGNGEYLCWLKEQDAVLERIELLLHKMDHLAQQAAVSKESNEEMRQQWQEEMEALKAQIDQTANEKLGDSARASHCPPHFSNKR